MSLAAGAAAGIAIACGEATRSEVPPKAGSRPATLRLHVRAGSEADTLDQRLPEFTSKFPSVKVTLEPFPGGEYQTKIVALMAANSLGDALWGGNAQSQSSKWAYLGGLSALDEFVRREKFDLNQYYRSSVDGGRLDGKLYGLPFKLHPSYCVIYYNANAVAEAGQQAPTSGSTWEQVLDLARRVKKVDGAAVSRWGLIIPATGQAAQFWITWARSWGADLYSVDGKKAQLDDPKFIAAVQYKHERILANPLHKAWLEAVEQVMPFREPWNFRGQDIENQVLKPQLDKLWKGEEAPTTAFFKQVNAMVQQILDQPRGA
ncbi:MAG: extracellular solute-binding protein [Chloroflexi bacterium]|nr:extracellular solute-binding protein [Chloroflexota bacterium]